MSRLQTETIQRLEIIVEKAKDIHDWRYMTFMRDKGIVNEVLADYTTETPEIISVRDAPDRESLHAVMAAIRFFTLPNENLMLFRDGWLPRTPRNDSSGQSAVSEESNSEEPKRADGKTKAKRKQPRWFKKDNGLSENWKANWLDIQEQLDEFLAREMGPIKFRIDGRIPTNGEIFEAFLFGDASHSTQRAILERWQKDEHVWHTMLSTLDQILHLVYVGIFNIAAYTKLELDGQPVPPPDGTRLMVQERPDDELHTGVAEITQRSDFNLTKRPNRVVG